MKKVVLWFLLTALAGIVLLSASACGVPQKDVDALKQQLAAKEQEAATVKQNNVLSVMPNAPPRKPAPPPKPGDPPPPPKPTPPPAEIVPLFFYVDTVTAGNGESKYNVDASRQCVITSTFKRGMHLVWRMKVADTATGKVLQATDVKSAVLKLPNGETKNFNFGRHGANVDSPWFWTTAWDAPPDYPLGVLDFTVEVTTNDGKTGTYKQIPVSLPERGIESRLTIVE